MKILFGSRQSGKTIEAIKIAAENSSYIVCNHQRECFHVAKIADEMGLKIPFPITTAEFIGGRFHGLGVKSFVIDNADHLFEQYINSKAKGVPIIAATMTGEWITRKSDANPIKAENEK